jgi:hypothetical protein
MMLIEEDGNWKGMIMVNVPKNSLKIGFTHFSIRLTDKFRKMQDTSADPELMNFLATVFHTSKPSFYGTLGTNDEAYSKNTEIIEIDLGEVIMEFIKQMRSK